MPYKVEKGTVMPPSSIIFQEVSLETPSSRLVATIFILLLNVLIKTFFKIGKVELSVTALSTAINPSFKLFFSIIIFI